MKRSDLTTVLVLTTVRDHGLDAYHHLKLTYPGKVIAAAFDREDKAGRIDSGVTSTRPWLTPEGERYLDE